jgi:hypothetical protein
MYECHISYSICCSMALSGHVRLILCMPVLCMFFFSLYILSYIHACHTHNWIISFIRWSIDYFCYWLPSYQAPQFNLFIYPCFIYWTKLLSSRFPFFCLLIILLFYYFIYLFIYFRLGFLISSFCISSHPHGVTVVWIHLPFPSKNLNEGQLNESQQGLSWRYYGTSRKWIFYGCSDLQQ